MLERPTTTASMPASEACTVLASMTQPSGVHGTSAGKPLASRPTLSGWKPSTSLAGSMAAMTFCGSICLRQRQLHQDAVDRRVGIELGDQLEQFGFARALRQLAVERMHAGFGHRLGLVADIDLARRIFADQHHRDARHDAAVAAQAVHGVGHLAAQVGRNRLAVDDACGHGQLLALPRRSSPAPRSALGRSPAIASRLTRAVAPAASVDVARRDAHRLGDQPDKRVIGFALARRRPHPRLEHAAAVGQCSMPSMASRPPLGVSRTASDDAAGHRRPGHRPASPRTQNTLG